MDDQDFELVLKTSSPAATACRISYASATLLELAGPDTTFVLVSDHGFHSDHLRPSSAFRKMPAGPAVPAPAQAGIFAMMGERCAPGCSASDGADASSTSRPRSSRYSACPWAKDMDGRVLLPRLSSPSRRRLAGFPVWELEPGECGMHHGSELRVDAGSRRSARAANSSSRWATSKLPARIQRKPWK